MARMGPQAAVVRVKREKELMSLFLLFLAVGGLTMTEPVQAEQNPLVSSRGNAAFLFSYDIKPGMQADFERGYKRHLEWHRNAKDPFTWYGWYVVTGDNAGRFVDGTFGLTFADFDKRVAPLKDLEDAVQNVSPYVNPVNRSVLRLRSDLSSGFQLQEQSPSRMTEVTTFVLKAGQETEFEDAIRSAASTNGPKTTWYELVSGGAVPTYIRMIPGDGFAMYEDVESFGVARSISSAHSETWLYVESLSYFP